MGYLSSLMRQTGIRPGNTVSRPAAAVPGIEAAGQPAPPPHRDTPSLPSPAGRMAEPEAPARLAETVAPLMALAAALPPPEIVVEIPAPPRTEIREQVVEIEKLAPQRAAPDHEMKPPRERQEASTEASSAPGIAAVRVGQPESPRPPREMRLPTLEEVRAWVTQPILQPVPQPVEQPVVEPAPWRPPAPFRAADVSPLSNDASENYSLEIGTIQIVPESLLNGM